MEVVAAIIIRDGEVFATQRGYGQWQGWWEFPGGKIESGDCPQDALKREINVTEVNGAKESRSQGNGMKNSRIRGI